MVYANCEIYEDNQGRLGVLTRTDDDDVHSFLEEINHQDYSINLDRRVIEFFMDSPTHTYKEWNDFLEDCGYCPLKDYTMNGWDDHLDEQIPKGFNLTFVPKNKFFRIERKESRTSDGTWLGMRQVVAIYDKEDFFET